MWIIIALTSYAIFAASSVADKYVLTGPLPNPRLYAFYVGVLGILIFIVAPFTGFGMLPLTDLLAALIAGAAFVFAILFMYSGLRVFEATSFLPVMGGMAPVFTLISGFVLFSGGRGLSAGDIAAFIILVLGIVVITDGSKSKITARGIAMAAAASLFFALYFLFSKYVFLNNLFWTDIIWIKAGSFIVAAGLFAAYSDLRREVIGSRLVSQNRGTMLAGWKLMLLILALQFMGAVAGILQSFSIYLAPVLYTAYVSAFSGTQYVFLLILAIVISAKFPKIINESPRGRLLARKITATFLIVAGTVIVALYAR